VSPAGKLCSGSTTQLASLYFPTNSFAHTASNVQPNFRTDKVPNHYANIDAHVSSNNYSDGYTDGCSNTSTNSRAYKFAIICSNDYPDVCPNFAADPASYRISNIPANPIAVCSSGLFHLGTSRLKINKSVAFPISHAICRLP
jgi:hypothetical protein